MAKHHWSKKAVLATLVISAGLLSTEVKANSSQENLQLAQELRKKASEISQSAHAISLSALNLTRFINQQDTFFRGYRSVKEDLDKLTYEKDLSNLREAYNHELDITVQRKKKIEDLEQENKKINEEKTKLTEQKLNAEEAMKNNFKSLQEEKKKKH